MADYETERRAREALELLDNETFKENLKDLQDYANNVFMQATATQEQIMAAHEYIRAASIVQGNLEKWITDKEFADHADERSAPS